MLPLLLLLCGQGAHADITMPPPWPGLPSTTWPTGDSVTIGSIGSEGNGLTEVSRAQQWIKIPAQAVAAVQSTKKTTYPADDPDDRYYVQLITAHAFLSSPAGATKGYGIGLPVTVQTVAFGAIPVRATMQLEQLRDNDDLPVPLTLRWVTTNYRTPRVVDGATTQEQQHEEVTGQVRVRLTALSVDGVDLGVNGCLSPPIDLDLQSNPFWTGDPVHDPRTHDPALDIYQGAVPTFPYDSKAAAEWTAALGEGTVGSGGVATGEVDIPAFSRCSTRSGEDISPLVTGVISGPGNPVTVATAAFNQHRGCGTLLATAGNQMVARAPYLGDPSDCDPDFAPPSLAYPARAY